MWFITLFLGAAIIFLINYWISSCFNSWKKRGVPCTILSSPVRRLYQLFFTSKTLLDILMEDYKILEGHRFGGYFQMMTPSIMIRDPDLVTRICIKDFSHFVDRNPPSEVKDLFMESLGSVTGDQWRTLRHKMTPTFTSGKLKIMFDAIKECGDEAVVFLKGKLGQDIESRDFAFKCNINVIGNVSFGLKVDALNESIEKDNEFLNVSRIFFKPSFILMLKFMTSLAMPKLRKYLRFSLVDERIDTFFRKLVKDMIAHREKTGEVRQDFLQLMLDQKKKEEEDSLVASAQGNRKIAKGNEVEPEDRELLDQLKYIQNGNINYKNTNVFTDDCIVAQTFVFISAGSETGAATLSYILYDLATNPDCQRKLQQEVDEVTSKHGFNYNSIKSMKYMDQVIDESMRLHATVAFLGRVCTQDYKIPDSDVTIEKGNIITLAVVGALKDPNYFPNPEEFDPDRFENPDALHPAIFLPFGTGPRMCIAKRLALLIIKILLTSIMKELTVGLSSKTKLPLKIQKASVFQHVDGGLWLKFRKRSDISK